MTTAALTRGERRPLSDLTHQTTVEVSLDSGLDGADVSVFGLDAERRLRDDRYFQFFNQPESPSSEVTTTSTPNCTRADFRVDLARLPQEVARLVFVVTHDTGPFGAARAGTWVLRAGGQELARYTFDGRDFQAEQAVMIAELYRHGGGWRLQAVGQGFNGGLQALLEYFGGEASQEAPASPAPTPAVPPVSLKKQAQVRLDKRIEQDAPQLVNLVKAATVSLEKRGLGEHTARVALALDISGSMTDEYRSGAVQALVERALALATRFDDDGVIDVFTFGQGAYHAGTVDIGSLTGYVNRMRVRFEGGTNYGKVMALIRRHYFGDAPSRSRALSQPTPVYVMFVTDGATQDRAVTEQQMRDSAFEPIFWKLMGIEQGGYGSEFQFLERLDDLKGRFLDNADFFKVRAPIKITDAELYELLLHEYDVWITQARAKGMLPPQG
ncbi:VWA domain-containing protein [Deinococcus pimensis]|uniref:VWA domain-containing protein n=1 Tax=Deinococcus pimensis TaxID=309888 RepID=UPI0004847B1C|nr:VWA domain-containing protein [Deinococcus pimensis]